MLANANSTRNEVYVVEVKSYLRPEGIEQIQQILRRFRRFFPEHSDKKLYGMLAVVDAPDILREEEVILEVEIVRIHYYEDGITSFNLGLSISSIVAMNRYNGKEMTTGEIMKIMTSNLDKMPL